MIRTKTDKFDKQCVFYKKIKGLTIRLNYRQWLGMFKCRKEVVLMSEQKRKIGFTVACVNEFAISTTGYIYVELLNERK